MYRGGETINYFFKYLLPQLLEYFDNDKNAVKEFVPKVIEQHYGKLLIKCEENSKEETSNK